MTKAIPKACGGDRGNQYTGGKNPRCGILAIRSQKKSTTDSADSSRPITKKERGEDFKSDSADSFEKP